MFLGWVRWCLLSRLPSQRSPVFHGHSLNHGADFPCQPLFPPLSVSYLGSSSTWSSDKLGHCTEQSWSGLEEDVGGKVGTGRSLRSLPAQTISRLGCFAVSRLNLLPKKITSRPCCAMHRSWLGLFREKWDNPSCGGRRGAQAGAAARV